jgi:DNA-binding PadR family transcriptional regulator
MIMFGRWNHGCGSREDHFAARRGGRGESGSGFGWGGRHGMGGGDILRFGKMLAQGDLRLLALWLIAEQPRHGYEIIKVLEEKTGGWYSPSPGVVYPTLTYLEEAGYVTAQAEGAKKLYTITEEGRVYLEQNRDFVDAVLERLTALAERVSQWRKWSAGEHEGRGRRGPGASRVIHAALDDLRELAADGMAANAEAESRIVEVLTRAAAELRKLRQDS